MKNLLFFGIVLASAASSMAQVLSWGKCPQVTVQQDFDLNRYLGKWYENRRFFASFEAFSDCVTADYSLRTDGTIKVNNTGINVFTGEPNIAIGTATPGTDEPAKLGVQFSPSAPEGAYWVLSTDYDTYTIIWSCTDVLFFNLQFGWILTREANGLSRQKTMELYEVMNNFDINTGRFRVTNQQNCRR